MLGAASLQYIFHPALDKVHIDGPTLMSVSEKYTYITLDQSYPVIYAAFVELQSIRFPVGQGRHSSN